MALFPLAAARAHDLLAKEVLAGRHPLAVANVLMEQEARVSVEGVISRDLDHTLPAKETLSEDAQACVAWFLQASMEAVDRLLPQSRPAAIIPEDAVSYCPRCLEPFELPSGQCPDCHMDLHAAG